MIEVIRPYVLYPYYRDGKYDWAGGFRAPVGMVQFLELYGRTCYKSEDRITRESAASFIPGIIKSGHESVIEHQALTVKFVCSRAASHQLVRHRIAAYSQESQRYCNYGKSEALQIIAPESFDVPCGIYRIQNGELQDCDAGVYHSYHGPYAEFLYGAILAYQQYGILLRKGAKPEDARFLLPNACKTEVVATFDLRQWRHVFRHRALNPKAQWEIRAMMLDVLSKFKKELPEIFGDL